MAPESCSGGVEDAATALVRGPGARDGRSRPRASEDDDDEEIDREHQGNDPKSAPGIGRQGVTPQAT